MPDLKCHVGDLNGFGCISSQLVDSLTSVNTPPDGGAPVPDNQWFGKITRFRYELSLSNGKVVTEEEIKAAISRGEITSCSLLNVSYTLDPNDEKIAYAEGKLEIVTAAGCVIPSSTAGNPHKFKHTLALVWRLTETKLLP